MDAKRSRQIYSDFVPDEYIPELMQQQVERAAIEAIREMEDDTTYILLKRREIRKDRAFGIDEKVGIVEILYARIIKCGQCKHFYGGQY